MAATFWIKNGAVAVSSGGNPILCDHCPCGAKSGLYICGLFTSIGGTTMNRISYWDGAAWNAVGTGMNDTVFDMTVYNGDLVAVGKFTTADGNSVDRVAIWNGMNWATMGGANDQVFCTITDASGKLWVGGAFNAIAGGGVSVGLAWYDGSWHDGSSGLSFGDIPNVLFVTGAGTLYMGTQGGKVYSWNGSTWSNTGTTNQTFINCLGEFNYLGGGGATTLYSAGVPAALHTNAGLMYLDTTWKAANAGFNYVYQTSILHFGSTLATSYKLSAGSDTFQLASVGSAVTISSATTPRTNTDTAGLKMAILSGNLIYGGGLATDGTTRVASYNGTSWSALGSQPNADVITSLVIP